ncbi:hypothetical protein RB200_26950 [Streptomyces sp. PmtG]
MRTGPRHAAPKKPLLTRLQVPAGKAIAIAAMPTAVLMGMGLTPQLAQAKPGVPENPFQDGPCVTVPDEPAKDAEDAEDAKGSRDSKGSGNSKGSGDSGDSKGEDSKPHPAPSADRPDTSEPEAKPVPPGDADKDSSNDADNDSEAEPSKPKNPLDPLGLGDALKDIFTPDGSKATPAPKPSDDEGDEGDEGNKDSTGSTGSRDGKEAGGDGDKAKDPAGDKPDDKPDDKPGTDEPKDDAEDKADDKAEEEPSGEEPSEDPMAPDANGKKPFPCVVEKKVSGDDEQTPVPIPNQPWHLEASSLLLMGADYQGVVNLTMPDGRKKQVLKYVIKSGTNIGDLHQIVEGPGGKKYHVQAAKGSMSTIRDGVTTMYTERISGKLFGAFPVTFDPEHPPPPLNIPVIYFTDVKVQQAGQFGGTLTIPGLHQSITD